MFCHLSDLYPFAFQHPSHLPAYLCYLTPLRLKRPSHPFLYFLQGSPSHQGSFLSPLAPSPFLSGVPAAGLFAWDSRCLQSWHTRSTATSLCFPPAPKHDFPCSSGQPMDS